MYSSKIWGKFLPYYLLEKIFPGVTPAYLETKMVWLWPGGGGGGLGKSKAQTLFLHWCQPLDVS
jgi:hypothetical protein